MSMTTHVTVRVPLTIWRWPGRKTVVSPALEGAMSIQTRADPALVKAMARAFRYQRMLDEGQYASISEMAQAERLERGYLGSLLRLTLLAPNIVDAILDRHQPEALSLPRLLAPFSTVWVEQRQAFNTPACSQKGAHNEPHHLHTR
jgi:hypothetical protein